MGRLVQPRKPLQNGRAAALGFIVLLLEGPLAVGASECVAHRRTIIGRITGPGK
jgi:hypothetical protein